jgi:hypothetical protein
VVAGLAVWGKFSIRLKAVPTPLGRRFPEPISGDSDMTKPAKSLLTRRNVVAMSVGAAATGAMAASLSFTSGKFAAPKAVSWWDRPTVNLATAGANDWLAQVGSSFTLESEHGDLGVKLASVTTFPMVGTRPAGLRDRAFALNFSLSKGVLPTGDRIYTMNHSTGVLKMYFSDTDKVLLAVFN